LNLSRAGASPESAHAVEDAAEVHVDNRPPAVDRVLGGRRLFAADASIVDGDVEATEALNCEVDHLFDRRGVRDVRADAGTVAFGQRGGNAFGGSEVEVGDDDLTAAVGEHHGAGFADTGTSSRYEGDFAGELVVIVHLLPPVLCQTVCADSSIPEGHSPKCTSLTRAPFHSVNSRAAGPSAAAHPDKVRIQLLNRPG
jgi:hypothetical protein